MKQLQVKMISCVLFVSRAACVTELLIMCPSVRCCELFLVEP